MASLNSDFGSHIKYDTEIQVTLGAIRHELVKGLSLVLYPSALKNYIVN